MDREGSCSGNQGSGDSGSGNKGSGANASGDIGSGQGDLGIEIPWVLEISDRVTSNLQTSGRGTMPADFVHMHSEV